MVPPHAAHYADSVALQAVELLTEHLDPVTELAFTFHFGSMTVRASCWRVAELIVKHDGTSIWSRGTTMSKASSRGDNRQAGQSGRAVKKKRGCLFPLLGVVAVVVLVSQCGSHSDSKKGADATASATMSAASSSAFPAARAAGGSDTDQAYIDDLRAVGISNSKASDDQLKTDGLATCMELRTTSDSVITIAVQMTRSPFNLTQREADMVVINAVKDICPEFQSRVDNP
ncbi:DUF732 domain-containing protein [Nocardia sp. NPDC059246]|uniref:DUF732 domain-containing protein n=1 Tax=unclassified Nocardia TaxID=2637762 RepID=UPI0036CA0239